jgi:hypothetical protein
MVPLHTSHGWVRPEARSGEWWHASQFFGGLAAPIFLTLTGVSLGLQWANQQARGQTPNFLRDAGRGLQIMVLGYMLRLQMWVIDAGGYAQPRTYPAQLLLLGAYALAYYAFGRLALRPLRHAGLALVAGAALALGLWLVSIYAPERARNLLRVDVLQCIGVSLVVLSALAALRGKHFGGRGAYLAAALACAVLAGWLRTIMPGPLPEAIAGYLARATCDGTVPVVPVDRLRAGGGCPRIALGARFEQRTARDIRDRLGRVRRVRRAFVRRILVARARRAEGSSVARAAVSRRLQARLGARAVRYRAGGSHSHTRAADGR